MRVLSLTLLLGCRDNTLAPTPIPIVSASASASASSAPNDEKPKRMENTCGELRAAAKGTIGRLYKDAGLYGTAVAYSRDIYYGSVTKASEVELLDRTPISEPKYKYPLVKVRVVCVAGDKDDFQGRVGWVDLRETTFTDSFDPRTGKVEQ